jgi:predicted nuclease with TOPRIM domain
MAEIADAQKVRARSELDKLHKGLVIGIDSTTLSKPAVMDQPLHNLDTIDVPLAVDMVTEALSTLDALKNLAARQQAELVGTAKDNLRLRDELTAAQKKASELQSQIAVVKLENQGLQNSLATQQEERQRLQERHGKTEEELKALVALVITSFRDVRKDEIPAKFTRQ